MIREHILTLLKLWVYKALDNLNSIKQEIDLLRQMELVKQDLPVGSVMPPAEKSTRPPQRGPIKPFVITKDMLKVCAQPYNYTSIHIVAIIFWLNHTLSL